MSRLKYMRRVQRASESDSVIVMVWPDFKIDALCALPISFDSEIKSPIKIGNDEGKKCKRRSVDRISGVKFKPNL